MPRRRGGAPASGGKVERGSRQVLHGSGATGTPPEGGPPSTTPDDPGGNRAKEKLAPGLYLVATPIGNAGDITLRALDVLRRADLVACEDTRVTARLLAIHGVATPRLAYHDHNADRVRPALL